MEKINIKFANMIGILLTICIISIILYPWSKQNIEKFETLSLYDSLNNTQTMADNYNKKINLLKTEFNEKGTVSIDDYKKLINDINDEFKKTNEKDLQDGILKIKNNLNQNKIKEIQDEITYLTNLTKNTSSPQNTNSPNQNEIKSIKSLQSGINLNVKYLNDDKNKNKIIMIFLNNGCLTYKDNKYISQYCEITNTDQHFILTKIDNGSQLSSKYLDNDYLKQQNLNNNLTNNSENSYPFYIICPNNNSLKCVKVDLDGISIEDCKPSTLNSDQRWIPSNFTIKSCS